MIDRLLDPIVRRLLRPRPPVARALSDDLRSFADDVTIEGRGPMRGWYLARDARARGVVLVVHGWGSDAGRSSGLARSLLDEGLAVLLIDLPGHGRSGPAPSYDVPHMLDDIGAARRWLSSREEVRDRRPGLIGISFGGVGAYAAASRDPSWAALALLAAPMGPLEASGLYLQAKGVPAALRSTMLRSIGRVLALDGRGYRGVECLANVHSPVLIVHGTDDRVVPLSHAQALASSPSAGEREVHWVQGGGHDLTDDAATGARIARFFARALAN